MAFISSKSKTAVNNMKCPGNSQESNDEDVDSSEEETDSSSENEEESENEEGTSKHGTSNEMFKLSCINDLDTNSRHKYFESLLGDSSHLSKLSSIPIKDLCRKTFDNDFTPWWDIAPEKKRESKAGTNDLICTNWFTKSVPDSTSWLSGPSSSNTALETTVAEKEDINVPSIYNQNPKPKGRRAVKKERKAAREKTTGHKWFNMKAPDVDEKIKMDMEMIRMRSVLDPKRFYKHNDRKGLPKYFQMGKVVDEGTDFYSSRLTKKQRKQTLVEELMADANIRQYNKRKYEELQHKQRGKRFKNKKK